MIFVLCVIFGIIMVLELHRGLSVFCIPLPLSVFLKVLGCGWNNLLRSAVIEKPRQGTRLFLSISVDKGKSTDPRLAFGPHRLRETPLRLLTLDMSYPLGECSLNSSQLTGYSDSLALVRNPCKPCAPVGRWYSWRMKLKTAPTLQAPGQILPDSDLIFYSCTVKHSKTL